MSGSGGDDSLCGHCGHVMLQDFDPSTIRGNPSTSAPFVKTTMISHLRRVMIATGQRDDLGRRLDLRSWGLNPGMSTVAR
jgi:hypothetical protein